MGSKTSKPEERDRRVISGQNRVYSYPYSDPAARRNNSTRNNSTRNNSTRNNSTRNNSTRNNSTRNNSTRISNYVINNRIDEEFDDNMLDDYYYHHVTNNDFSTYNKKRKKLLKSQSLRNYHIIKLEDNDLELQDECPICLEDLKVKESIYLIPCCHYYHKKCLKEWVSNENICPSCRMVLGNHSQEDIDMSLFTRENKLLSVKKIRDKRIKNTELYDLNKEDLKYLLTELNINHTGVTNKKKLINLLIEYNNMDVTDKVFCLPNEVIDENTDKVFCLPNEVIDENAVVLTSSGESNKSNKKKNVIRKIRKISNISSSSEISESSESSESFESSRGSFESHESHESYGSSDISVSSHSSHSSNSTRSTHSSHSSNISGSSDISERHKNIHEIAVYSVNLSIDLAIERSVRNAQQKSISSRIETIEENDVVNFDTMQLSDIEIKAIRNMMKYNNTGNTGEYIEDDIDSQEEIILDEEN